MTSSHNLMFPKYLLIVKKKGSKKLLCALDAVFQPPFNGNNKILYISEKRFRR